MLIDKRSVIDIVWQYSRVYGERLSDCERLFENEEGYAALILLFEITENICKFAAGNYEEKFQIIVDKLHKQDVIGSKVKNFLSDAPYSVRKIRNKFAHANLFLKGIVKEEKGKDIFYAFSENETCLLIYDMYSTIVFNILKNIYALNKSDEIDKQLDEFNLKVVTLTKEQKIMMNGIDKDDYIKMVSLGISEDKILQMSENY